MVAIPLGVEVWENVPQGGEGHDTLHTTPLFAVSSVTVAVTCAVEFASTLAKLAATVTKIPGIVIVAELYALGSLTEVAVIVTCKSLEGSGTEAM